MNGGWVVYWVLLLSGLTGINTFVLYTSTVALSALRELYTLMWSTKST